MKPIYLELCGINSFSEPAVIDFNHLMEYGIFGVFGDTGSGKSTILDCINFALYGRIYRSREVADIINCNSDRAYVTYEFEIEYEKKRRRYRIERELKRKNATQFIKVYEREGDTLRVISDGVRESNALLLKIVGLEQKDFEKCIALPQGEFAQFVQSVRGERLKLIARLFDLEEYGEKLTKKVNAKSSEFQTLQKIAETKLEPYLSYSEEGQRELADVIEALNAREERERKELDGLRKEEKRLSERLAKKREAEKINGELTALEARRGEIEKLELGLGRIEKAQAVTAAAQELERRSKVFTDAKQALLTVKEALLAAEQRRKKFENYDEETEAEEIAKLSERRARAEQAEERVKKAEELNRKLGLARRAYAEEVEKFKGFSYEAEKEKIEDRIKALGEGNFVDFLKEHGKATLLQDEYEVFAQELSAIYEKHPETEETILPLIQKYSKLSRYEGSVEDIKSAYEARESQRKTEHANLVALEKENGLYRAHRERLQQLATEGVRLKEELQALEEASAVGETVSRAELEKELACRRKQRKETLEGRELAEREYAKYSVSAASTEEKFAAAEENFLHAKEALRVALETGNFTSAEEAKALCERFGSREEAALRIEKFRNDLTALTARKRELEREDLSVSEEQTTRLREDLTALETLREETLRSLAIQKDSFQRYDESLKVKRELESEYQKISEQATLYERLKKLIEGNKFMEFVAEEYLQNIAEAGSRRLLQLTSGRYFLRYDAAFFVGDNLAGGNLRSVTTLSGGEIFLVSLSLALALSAEIVQKSLRPIEFFFLDEGFGTLDDRLIDIVMDSLEKLKGEHFSIGIISHVEELKHRIERKLIVEKATEKHGSRVTAN